MKDWPTCADYHVFGKLQRLLFFSVPALPSYVSDELPIIDPDFNITNSNRGILNMFSEDEMIENQSKNTPGYQLKQ